MYLDTTTKSLELLLAGAITTNHVVYTVDYGQVANDNSTSAPKEGNGVDNGGTAVTMVAAPGSNLVREVLHLTVYNADTVAATVTIQVNDNTTKRVCFKCILQTLESLSYESFSGWRVLDVNGNLKGVGATGATGATGPHDTLTVDTDGATVTFDLSVNRLHQVTLGGNRTLALSNEPASGVFTIELIQDGTGSRTVTWWSGIKWPGGTTPTLTTAINKADTFTFLKTGSGAYLGFTVGLNS